MTPIFHADFNEHVLASSMLKIAPKHIQQQHVTIAGLLPSRMSIKCMSVDMKFHDQSDKQ